MARRITSGTVGNPSVGGVVVSSTADFTTAINADISITPQGTGRFLIGNNTEVLSGNELRFRDSDGSNYVGFYAPALTGDTVWALPSSDGSNEQVLTTNGGSVLSTSAKDVSIVNETSSSSTYYVTLTSASSGRVGTLNTSTAKLSFVPSSGALAVSGNLSVGGDLSISGGASGILDTTIVTGSTTLPDVDKSYLVISTSSFTVTLPDTSTNGRTIKIFDGGNFSGSNITFARNGKTIGGLSENLIANQSSSFTLIYRDGNWNVNFYY
jgi:hypothetical protein